MEIIELVNRIKLYAQKYYSGENTISDSEFDRLTEELKDKDPNNELFSLVGWGYDVSLHHKIKVEHLGEAYGISSKIYVDKESVVPGLSNKVKTGKIDGGSVEVVYYKGKFMKAISRGNGKIGIDITHILKYNVPIELPFSYTGNFLGEYVLPDNNMTKEDSIAQRNIPNGFLMRNEVTAEECSRFIYVPYKINRFKPLPELRTDSRISILEFIQDCGFNTLSRIDEHSSNNSPYENIIKILKTVYGSDRIYQVPLDGIVTQSNKIVVSEPDKEGYCTIDYIDESAYKTVNDKAEVVIDRIEWNLTRLGRMIPKAVFDKIELSGAEVKQATAHNAQYIIDNELGAGSKIEVVRSGEVIPYISDILESRNLNIPEFCPECGSRLIMEGVHLVCNNKDCSAKSYESIKRWIKVLGDVDNLGSSMIDKLIEHFNIETVHDIYDDRFTFEELSKVEGFGKSKIQIVVNMFKKLLELKPVNHYLVALNIPGLSYETAYKLIEGTSLELMIINDSYNETKLIEEIHSVKGLSESVINNIRDSYNKIREYLPYVRIIGFSKFYKSNNSASQVRSTTKDQLLKIYVTGKLNFFRNRNDLYSELSDKIIQESKITECDYFVTNKQPLNTKHYKEAINNKVKIITEEELLQILNKGDN